MEPNPYGSPARQAEQQVQRSVSIGPRMPIAAAILIPVLAYLTAVVLYIAEEVRYNAAERERVMKALDRSAGEVSN